MSDDDIVDSMRYGQAVGKVNFELVGVCPHCDPGVGLDSDETLYTVECPQCGYADTHQNYYQYMRDIMRNGGENPFLEDTEL